MKKLLISRLVFGLAGGAAASLTWIMLHGEFTWAGVVFGMVFLGTYLAIGIIAAAVRKKKGALGR